MRRQLREREYIVLQKRPLICLVTSVVKDRSPGGGGVGNVPQVTSNMEADVIYLNATTTTSFLHSQHVNESMVAILCPSTVEVKTTM